MLCHSCGMHFRTVVCCCLLVAASSLLISGSGGLRPPCFEHLSDPPLSSHRMHPILPNAFAYAAKTGCIRKFELDNTG